jgi:hypothetical protein
MAAIAQLFSSELRAAARFSSLFFCGRKVALWRSEHAQKSSDFRHLINRPVHKRSSEFNGRYKVLLRRRVLDFRIFSRFTFR